MKKIGLISDTHGVLHENVFHHFRDVDEIWHAGDFGDMETVDRLRHFKPLRGVYGNIDGAEIRSLFPEQLFFEVEKVHVYMQHIGGYPGKYATGVRENILRHKSKIFVSGHSHILKIIYDEKLDCLHMNPGAAGNQGWHKVKTAIKFDIENSDIKNCNVVEL